MKIIEVPVRNEQDYILVNVQVVGNVKYYIYLGAMINVNYDDSKEIKRRIAMAKTAVISPVKIWQDRVISITTKGRLLKSLVFSVTTYGSECWMLKTIDTKKINSFKLWCYRCLLRIKWTDKKTNEYVLNKIGTSERSLTTIIKQKMVFSGMYSENVTIVRTY